MSADEASAAGASDEVPALAGPYVLGELLGEGAAARVHAATDPRGREVAIKLLKRAAKDDPTASARLEREAQVLARLDHPGLVRVLDAGRDGRDHPYIVLERVRGPSLREHLAKEGPLPPAQAWRIVRAVAVALRAAHAAGVLHRDLTPSNVLLDAQGRPKLGDFGLAFRATDPRLSREGASTGTPAYMAPEQWWGASLDARTDVYGLGAILYECLSGRPPWHGEPADILHRVATGEPAPLTQGEAPASIAAFVRRALAREPGERPPDVERFVAEGDRAFGHVARRAPVEVIAVAAGVLALPIALGFGGSHDPRDWMHEAGMGGWVVLMSALVGAILGMRLRAWRPLLYALPLFSGALVFVTGKHVVLAHVEQTAREARFELFHLGLAEASAGWFVGAWLAAVLFAADAARVDAASSVRAFRPPTRARIAAIVCIVAAVLAAEAGAAAVAGVALLLLLLGGPSRGPEHALSACYAICSLALVAWIRLESESARLFFEVGLARAERVAALIRVDDAQVAGFMAALVCGIALPAAAQWRGMLTWPRARIATALVTDAAIVAVLLGSWLASRADRAALYEEIAPRLAALPELDPPEGSGDGPARLGATLQLGRRRIAVDGVDVAPIEALDGESATGPLVLAERLAPRVRLEESPELVLAADSGLAFRVIERALAAARDLGVRRVDVLLRTGPPVLVDPSAPPEVAIVLPRDLRAMEVRLAAAADDRALRPDEDARFDEVVRALASRPNRSLAIRAR